MLRLVLFRLVFAYEGESIWDEPGEVVTEIAPRITGTPDSVKYLELIFEPNGPATQDDFSGDFTSSTVKSLQPLGSCVSNSG